MPLLNRDTPILNNTFLGLPLTRELFVDPETSLRSDAYQIRQSAGRIEEALGRPHDGGIGSQVADRLGEIAETQRRFSDRAIEAQESMADGLRGLSYAQDRQTDVLQAEIGKLYEATTFGNLHLQDIAGSPAKRSAASLRDKTRADENFAHTIAYLSATGALEPGTLEKAFNSRLLYAARTGESSESMRERIDAARREIQDCRRECGEIEEAMADEKDPEKLAELKRALEAAHRRSGAAQRELGTLPDGGDLPYLDAFRRSSENPKTALRCVDGDSVAQLIGMGALKEEAKTWAMKRTERDGDGNIGPWAETQGVGGIWQHARTHTMQLNELNRGMDAANSHLEDLNKEAIRANENLGAIREGVAETNGRLGDIALGISASNRLTEKTHEILGELGNVAREEGLATRKELAAGFEQIASWLRYQSWQHANSQDVLCDERSRSGMKLLEVGRTQEAEEAFRKGLECSPHNLRAALHAALLASRANRPDADRLLELAIALLKDPDARAGIGRDPTALLEAHLCVTKMRMGDYPAARLAAWRAYAAHQSPETALMAVILDEKYGKNPFVAILAAQKLAEIPGALATEGGRCAALALAPGFAAALRSGNERLAQEGLLAIASLDESPESCVTAFRDLLATGGIGRAKGDPSFGWRMKSLLIQRPWLAASARPAESMLIENADRRFALAAIFLGTLPPEEIDGIIERGLEFCSPWTVSKELSDPAIVMRMVMVIDAALRKHGLAFPKALRDGLLKKAGLKK